MGKPKSRAQLSMAAAGVSDDWGGIPDSHWSYQFYKHVLLAFDDAAFGGLYQSGGRQPVSPRLLCGVMILQYMHRVSDRVAADNTVMRRDWRIALGLEPGYQAFHPTVLCYFRRRLLEHDRERAIFDTVWQRVQDLGLVRQHTKVRVDATHLIADVAVLSRGDMLREALRVVVCNLGMARPKVWRRLDFLSLRERYGTECWLGGSRDTEGTLCDLARDGQRLLRLCGPYDVKGRAVLERMLAENFVFAGDEPTARPPAELPPDHLVTPHEPDVEVGKEGAKLWNGDKVHVVETTVAGEPGFISDVVVTGPRVPDNILLPEVAQRVAFNTPAVDTVLADSGYAAAGNTAAAAELGLDLVSRPRVNNSRGFFPATDFDLDLARQVARCPQGHESLPWRRDARLRIKFPRGACRACPRRAECTNSPTEPRTLTLSPHYEQLVADRARAGTAEHRKLYRQRAGIEATMSELVHRCGLRRSRYRGRRKRALHALLAATALNVRRLLRRLAPRDTPRQAMIASLRGPWQALTRAPQRFPEAAGEDFRPPHRAVAQAA